MAKKKSNRRKIFDEYIIEGISKANPNIPIEDLRYSVRNEVSTPNASIADFEDYYNPELSMILESSSLSGEARRKEIEKYGNKIPYIKGKEIRLRKGRFNTGKISTNLLDSIYDASQRVGIPFEEALGLAGRESTLGIGRGFKEGTEISPTELMSNWQQVQDIINTNSSTERYNNILKRYGNKESISEEDIGFVRQYFKNEKREIDSTRPIEENPIDNALKYYKEGRYNKNDSRHTNMVKADGKTLMSEPSIQNWLLERESNKHDIGGFLSNIGSKLDGWNTNATDKFLNSRIGKGLSSFGIKAGGLGSIANTAATAIGGALAGGRSTAVGNVMQKVGSLASNIPGVGGLIGAGVNLLGGITNGAFGSKLNAENIAAVEGDIKQALNFTSNAGDYDALASNYAGLQGVRGFNQDFIGKDGWVGGSKAKDKFNSLKTQAEEAEEHQLLALTNNATNIANNNQQLMEANYTAYGGPINMKYKGTMSPFGNQFDDGGPLDTRMELLRRLEEKRNRRGTYGGGKSGGAGAGSLFLESPDDFILVKDTILVPYRETFNDAFGKARAAGLNEFMFDNKAYTTELGDNPDNNRAGEERAIEGLLPVERTKKVKNKKAEGGDLFTNGVTQINNGGTHEQNKYEGVQMGIDPQGIPNLVEEGEVIFDDYVFSNRLRVPKAIRQKYKLRGVTFADAAKQLQKESEERPNDPISKNGLEANMQMLQQEQETVRMKKESNKFARGGKLGRLYDGTGGDANWLYKPMKIGYTPSKEDILADMETSYPYLTKTPEVTQNSREMLVKDLLDSNIFKVKPMKDNWLRKLSIGMSGVAVANDLFGGNEPDYSNANIFARAIEGTNRPISTRTIGNYLTYKPFDRDFYINKLNEDASATRRAVMNTSGGNRAAAMADILAADYNYGNQLGDLARKAEEYNLSQRQQVEDFNRATNTTNAEMAMKADLANAEQAMQRARMYGSLAEYRDKILAANRAEKSANLTNFIQGLGDLGRELTDRDMLRWLADVGVLTYNNKGEYIAKKNACGGRINKKKRGGFTI